MTNLNSDDFNPHFPFFIDVPCTSFSLMIDLEPVGSRKMLVGKIEWQELGGCYLTILISCSSVPYKLKYRWYYKNESNAQGGSLNHEPERVKSCKFDPGCDR